MKAFLGELFLMLRGYVYGIGWVVIALVGAGVAYRVLARVCPLDLRRQLEAGNLAVALVVGLYLAGTVLGILYLAAHIG